MRIIVLLLTLWTAAASAQSYPAYTSTTVNDLAGLLAPADAATLAMQLAALRDETGVEMTVVTLDTQDRFAPGVTLETFATGLFDQWGVGDATRNDGVLVLILQGDRAMRVELGRAYGRAWDRAAQEVVDTHFLPAFRANDYPRGIMQGSTAVIDQIIRPFLAGQPAPETSDGGLIQALIMGVFAISVLGFILRAALGARIGDALARFRACPQCGQTGGLRQSRETVFAATRSTAGSGRLRRHCSLCGFADESAYSIPPLPDRSSGGSFGGGSSGGGGASGRW